MHSPLTTERYLRWDACYNVRDLGGHASTDGRITRRGVFVRADSVGRLSEKGCAALEAYGVRTIIDLRVAVEVRDEPSPLIGHATITSHHLPLDPNDRTVTKAVATHKGAGLPAMAAVNAAFLQENQAQIVAIVRTMAGAREGGVLFHCHAGRDRTGLIAMLLLGLVGVPAEAIVADYAVSFNADPETMAATLRYVDRAYGGVVEYLRAAGLTAGEIAAIRARFSEDGQSDFAIIDPVENLGGGGL